MTSSRKLVANGKNAQRSTGPRPKAGQSCSRLNAIKHGLATPADALPAFASDAAQVAQALTGEVACNSAIREAAVRVAKATIDVLRAHRAKSARSIDTNAGSSRATILNAGRPSWI